MKVVVRKAVIVEPPEPTWRGTRMQLNVPTDAAVFGIAVATLSEGTEAVTVDWGDGTADVFSGGIDHATHTYANTGRYEVLISDDVESFGVNGETESAPYSECVAWIEALESNAANLVEFKRYAFSGAASLTRIELDGSGVRHLVAGQFKDCTSLGGALHFMNVTWVGSRKGTFVFTGCPDITEIHFAVENEEAITSLSQYQNDPTLGTGTAVCIFDL